MKHQRLPLNFLQLPILLLVAIFSFATLGTASPQHAEKGLRCGSDIKLDRVLNHPDDFFGKVVTVEGEMHRTFSDKVFSIEDDDFLRDDDLLVITNASKSEVVKPVKDSIAEGKDVCVTGMIEPFHRSEMESKFGPLNIESRASHYPEGSPVMIIEQTTATAIEREKPSATAEAQPVPEPVPGELENESAQSSTGTSEVSSAPEQTQTQTERRLPATSSALPLLGLSGMLSLLAAAGLRYRRH